jgi:hypothetical protein
MLLLGNLTLGPVTTGEAALEAPEGRAYYDTERASSESDPNPKAIETGHAVPASRHPVLSCSFAPPDLNAGAQRIG